MKNFERREFMKLASIAGMGVAINSVLPAAARTFVNKQGQGKRIGIIGLDTSHSVAMSQELNANVGTDLYGGYHVVAAYPYGSLDILSATSRIGQYKEEIQKYGVEIVDSIEELLKKVDVVQLETNDGRRHLEQAIPVLKAGKRMFIDKPIAASLADAMVIFQMAEKLKVPVFSSSSLRFMSSVKAVQNGSVGKILGADTYSPATLEKTHPDFFWYGIHGVETLFAVMGTGCETVVRAHTKGTDLTVGTWADGRIGSFRGTRTGKHDYGGTVFGHTGEAVLGPFEGYKPLLIEIVEFFKTGVVPVSPAETLEICAFIEAADASKNNQGKPVSMNDIREAAKKEAAKKWKQVNI